MLTANEQRLLHWLAGEWFEGVGSVVDAGCFLGGSTFALATGLTENRSPAAREKSIHSFDLFSVTGGSWEGETLRGAFGLDAGQSFLDIYRRGLADWIDRIVVHEGDLMEHTWNGEPIEILFVDIGKSHFLHDHLMRQWFTRLIPGRSIVVQQDFGWSYYHWGNVAMEVLKNRFARLDDIPSASRVYLCVEPVSAEDVERACYDSMWPEDKMAAMEAALQTVRGGDFEPHLLYNLALVAHDVGRGDALRSAVHELQLRFPQSLPARLASSQWPELRVELPSAVAGSAGQDKAPSGADIVGRLSRLLGGGAVRRLFGDGASAATPAKALSSATIPHGEPVERKPWVDAKECEPFWTRRIERMAKLISPGEVVGDFGCGMMWLEPLLPKGCRYVPVDSVRRDDRTHVIDLNGPDLTLPGCDTAFFSGCFEHVDDLSRLIDAVRDAGAKRIVAAYCSRDRFPDLAMRRKMKWRTDFDLPALLVKLLRFGPIVALDECDMTALIVVDRGLDGSRA